MMDVKWIKITTDIFNNRKIRQIEAMPEGDAIIVIWTKLLCLAGTTNDCGCVYLTQDIPYTAETLATEFHRPLNTVKLALKTFEQFGMISIVNNFLYITNWEKYQSQDKLEIIKEQTRKRVANFREKQKQITVENSATTCNVTCNANVTQCNATDIDIDIYRNTINSISVPSKSEICPEQEEKVEEATDQTVMSLPLNDKSQYSVKQSDIETWQDVYPNVDVVQQLKAMRLWLNDNPKKRKTKNGIKRFISGWLSREQDRPHNIIPKSRQPNVFKENEMDNIEKTDINALRKGLFNG